MLSLKQMKDDWRVADLRLVPKVGFQAYICPNDKYNSLSRLKMPSFVLGMDVTVDVPIVFSNSKERRYHPGVSSTRAARIISLRVIEGMPLPPVKRIDEMEDAVVVFMDTKPNTIISFLNWEGSGLISEVISLVELDGLIEVE